MPDQMSIALFAEDRAHEAFIVPLIHRRAQERKIVPIIDIVSARGGHPKVFSELDVLQRAILIDQYPRPDLLVVAIDGNCQGHAKRRNEILDRMNQQLRQNTVAICPDPHIERWFMDDPDAFQAVAGAPVRRIRYKCARGYYKSAVAEGLVAGGNPVLLGGIEFAEDIVIHMDLYKASRNDGSFKAALADLDAAMQDIQRRD